MSFAKEVKPGQTVRLKDINPEEDGGLTKEEALARLAKLGDEMSKLQELLFAAGKHGLLLIFQGRDTAGKDGAINRLLSFINVQSTIATSFKEPTTLEMKHDFLWRVHPHVPAKGGIAIFNRSHYEDVLISRVHDLVPKATWKARYGQINAFEELIAGSDTIILKFYLHISKDEQKQRLLDREQDVEKAWKLSLGDWKERELWGEYTDAYEDAISKCSTPHAPWFVVPANHKWYRDLVIAEAIVEALKPFESQWRKHLRALGKDRLETIQAFRAEKEKAKSG